MQIDGRKFSITLIVQLSYMRSNIEIIKSLTKENYKIESKKQQKMAWSYFEKKTFQTQRICCTNHEKKYLKIFRWKLIMVNICIYHS